MYHKGGGGGVLLFWVYTSKKYCTYLHSAQILIFQYVAEYKVNFFIWSNFPLPVTPLHLYCLFKPSVFDYIY